METGSPDLSTFQTFPLSPLIFGWLSILLIWYPDFGFLYNILFLLFIFKSI